MDESRLKRGLSINSPIVLKVNRKDGKWHVFNGRCQIAGPYESESEALQVLGEIEGGVAHEG